LYVIHVDPKPPNLAAKLNIFSINRKAAKNKSASCRTARKKGCYTAWQLP